MRVKAKGDGSEVWNVRSLRHMLMEKRKVCWRENRDGENIYRGVGREGRKEKGKVQEILLRGIWKKKREKVNLETKIKCGFGNFFKKI